MNRVIEVSQDSKDLQGNKDYRETKVYKVKLVTEVSQDSKDLQGNKD